MRKADQAISQVTCSQKAKIECSSDQTLMLCAQMPVCRKVENSQKSKSKSLGSGISNQTLKQAKRENDEESIEDD